MSSILSHVTKNDDSNNLLLIPERVAIESSAVCQLKCPTCPTAQGVIRKVVKPGFLKIEYFEKILDKNPWIKTIELANFGETFLNPHFLEIMRLAYDRGVALTVQNGTNLNSINSEVLEGLVKYQVRILNCSIDGTTQEVYSKYRRGGNLDTVFKNIKKINEHKAKYKSKYPVLNWQFVVFGFNEHQIDEAKSMASDLGMSIRFKLQWDENFSPVKNQVQVAEVTQTGVSSRSEFKDKYGISYLSDAVCKQLWESPQFNWDGTILGCCINSWGDFGQVIDNDFKAAINNQKLNEARQLLMGKKVNTTNLPCFDCQHYIQRKSNGRWIDEKFDLSCREQKQDSPAFAF